MWYVGILQLFQLPLCFLPLTGMQGWFRRQIRRVPRSRDGNGFHVWAAGSAHLLYLGDLWGPPGEWLEGRRGNWLFERMARLCSHIASMSSYMLLDVLDDTPEPHHATMTRATYAPMNLSSELTPCQADYHDCFKMFNPIDETQFNVSVNVMMGW